MQWKSLSHLCNMKTQRQADLTLLLVTLFWGIANVVSDIALGDIDTIQLNAIRFGVAFICAFLFFFKKMKKPNGATLKAAAAIGVLLCAVYILATEALLYTDVTNVGFLLAQHVIMVPILNRVFRKKKTEKKLLLCIAIAIVGLAMLTLKGGVMTMRLGDWMTLLSTFIYAVDMILTEIFVGRDDVDPLQLGVYQLGVCAAVFMVIALFTGRSLAVTGARPWMCIIFLAFFATAFPFIVQPIAQRLTSVTRVGLIFSAEPLFTALAAFVMINERLHFTGYIGAGIMLLAIVLMNVEFPGKKEKTLQ